MNTEITDKEKPVGWVLYDADCRFCVRLARRFRNLLAARHIKLLPLQTPWVREQLGLGNLELLAEMRLLKPDGEIFGGADALLEICRYYRLAWPVYRFGKIPAVTKLLHTGYRWIARNRTCGNGVCNIKKPTVNRQSGRLTDFLPLSVLPAMAFAVRTQLAPWVFMWVMAFALYAGCKWLTYRLAVRHTLNQSLPRTLGYLLIWPGMDAAEFLNKKIIPAKPLGIEWIFALAKITLGSILVGVVTRLVFPAQPLICGWVGMIGVILLLHFGLFHIGSLVWRQAGVKATPLMQNPVLAKSLAEFWGERWNTAFNEIAFRFTYRPLRRSTTPVIAMLLVFGLSGLIHELVISLPARAGYGLPTAYFLIQGFGVVAERTKIGQRIGLRRGVRGWLFTMLITAGPVFWLFHPPFIKHVILPMLTAIGAT